MSYDLILWRPEPGRSQDETPESMAESMQASGPPDDAVWSVLVGAARQVLGEVSVGAYSLTDEVTGIRLLCWRDGATISVPYWYTGAEAEAVLRTMYALGEAIEREAGLHGYDPQVEMPLVQGIQHVEAGVRVFDTFASKLNRLRRDPPWAGRRGHE